jgi:hypothetical protein
MDTRERILRKIGSWPITHRVMRKLLAVKFHRIQKAPEVQERLKALSAATPDTLEQRKAFFDCTNALHKELSKTNGLLLKSAWPREAPEIEGMLQKLEKGNATASQIEEFRRLAGEVLRNWQPWYSPAFEKRIESALSLLERS